MVTTWRWDQGRLPYFQYDVLKEISRVLVKYEGKNINENEMAAQFKEELISKSGMPFLPNNYKVNRNYSRVFQCALLATTEGRGILKISDICRCLAQDQTFASPDDYFIEVIRRFRFPFPAFQEYNSEEERIYPFIALIKYLIAQQLKGEESKVNIQDIASYIIGNGCTGFEDVEFYQNLTHTGYSLEGEEVRQLREMLVFISQISFLKIFNGFIYLDIAEQENAKYLWDNVLKPINPTPYSDKVEEFLSITKIKDVVYVPVIPITTNTNFVDMEFSEGKRKRVQHLRVERSPLLRRYYIQIHTEPICEACGQNMVTRYPWTTYMLDLHHLLPLSSAIRITNTGTSLSDMVGLCPSCHRAIHSYYRKWLKSNEKDDFRDKSEAMAVYLEAIKQIA